MWPPPSLPRQTPEAASELICPQCVADTCTFLLLYPHLLMPPDPVPPPEDPEDTAANAASLTGAQDGERESKGEGEGSKEPSEPAVAAAVEQLQGELVTRDCGEGAEGRVEADPLVRALAGGNQPLPGAAPETASSAAGATVACDSSEARSAGPSAAIEASNAVKREGAGGCDEGRCRVKEQHGGRAAHDMVQRMAKLLSAVRRSGGAEATPVAVAQGDAAAPASQGAGDEGVEQAEVACEEQAAQSPAREWRGELVDKLPGPAVWRPGWAAFLPDGWRSKICACEDCKE